MIDAPVETVERRVADVIVQITPFCNIDCSYCYLTERSNTSKASLEVVTETAKRLIAYQGRGPLTWLWHAGEPLAVGFEHFERCHHAVIEAFGDDKDALTFHVQTNATLVDARWARFFREHGYRVGVSIDGPADVHDLYRRTRSGAGTFDKAMRGLKILQDEGVTPSALAVVTSASIDRPRDILQFFGSNGVSNISFNFEETEGLHRTSSLAEVADDGVNRPGFVGGSNS